MSVVLDASALLAFLQGEPGADTVENALHHSLISSVNWAEVIQRSVAGGVSVDGLRADVEALGVTIEDFTASQAEQAGGLWLVSRERGLSVGDRACLALGVERNAPVLTTDPNWSELPLPMQVVVLG